MTSEVLVALCALAGTMFGTVAGIFGANKLVMYRIEQLEMKVDKHNSVLERTALLERDQKTVFRLIDSNRDEINKIKGEM